MNENVREKHEREAREYLDRVGKTYVLNRSSGLQEPVTYREHDTDERRSNHAEHVGPLIVELRRDWTAFFVSFTTLVLVALYTSYSYKLWLQESTNAGRVDQQLALAQLQAVTAKKTLDTSAEQMRRSVRAYMIPDFENRHPEHDSEGHVYFSIGLKNSGTTAAKHVHLQTVMVFLRPGQEVSFSYKAPEYPDGHFTGVWYPGQNLDIPSFAMKSLKEKRVFSNDDLKAMFASSNNIVAMYGKITYYDVFGKRHWSTFCGGLISIDPRSHASRKCANYNDSDNN